MERVTRELYSDADIGRLQKRLTGWKVGLGVLAAVGLAICVTLAALTRTANASAMELSAVLTSTVFGWVVIYFAIFEVTPRRRELGHVMMLRSGERQRLEGTVTVTDERLIIRRSIAIRRVQVQSGDQVQGALVIDTRAEALKNAGAAAVYIVNGYVAAYDTDIRQ